MLPLKGLEKNSILCAYYIVSTCANVWLHQLPVNLFILYLLFRIILSSFDLFLQKYINFFLYFVSSRSENKQ